MGANPSAWSHRLPILMFALFGLAVSCYLAGYQLGLVAAVWDPLFGSSSSARVLHSPLSAMLPVPDATLGAVGYLVDIVLTSVGGDERWHTARSIVLLLGVVTAGMALVSVGLVGYQATVVRHFCTLCLASAAASFAILPLAWQEVTAAWTAA